MVKIRKSVLIAFCLSLTIACYLGFASLSFVHDKALHFFVFAILTGEFFLIFQASKKSLKVLATFTFCVCTVAASIVSEALQNYVNPKRVFDINDIYCNAFGSLCGLILAFVYQAWSLNKHRRGQPQRLSAFSPPDEESMPAREGPEDYVSIEMQDVPRN
ncbi:Piso0_002804 [Millerozyma farinosa CBS 7064]|uniref:Piso0_002804 protein n=1 Tax=Pichia sorbitophila (strain ATCC MYA-4447 / BCRC 22081 / CBS 7064 / NBRC 10061 / NRRL Y-12695) TaxID=559304 RepID=G8YDJ9_PICSO|nr:Piso0_002804 [Millerozyma farinosa CBS 7064]